MDRPVRCALIGGAIIAIVGQIARIASQHFIPCAIANPFATIARLQIRQQNAIAQGMRSTTIVAFAYDERA
jgi:tryptophan-rich sensory protein